ncbi:hypothetical protein N7539_006661 [Penicillium diatomitis]|uniref:Uncharacterized protein n=1 Tax=Penicillium diatomitis TaxID=2819901 RepID=A0A9W9X255_9EURO|nr:uncharacterized protein N7539_006661 [Penicillium diatomitis]KAJ5480767.1 hypothetical protein N7539_006661 [Penicillium diatomitis]
MASLMKKLRRKRRLSSELDARWGDPSISYPNQGSWNQWDQPSGFVANASMGAASASFQSRERKDYMSTEPISTGDFGRSSDSHYHGSDVPMDQLHAISVIPKGYFNENIRHRVDRSRRAPPARGLGINGTLRDTNHSQKTLAGEEDSCEDGDEESDDDCCEEDHEDLAPGRFGQLRYDISVRSPLAADPRQQSPQENYDRAHDYHRPSKSPPLSVTQRMRRLSQQSAATDPISSTAGTASSRCTSYTAASSVSVPTLPPSTPRLAIKLDHALHDKRPIHRSRPKMDEAQSQQRMVPSYDELYG